MVSGDRLVLVSSFRILPIPRATPSLGSAQRRDLKDGGREAGGTRLVSYPARIGARARRWGVGRAAGSELGRVRNWRQTDAFPRPK